MQKKIIALAVAGLVSGAAFAQSNVTVYGVADGYYGRLSADGMMSNNYFNSGGLSGSRIGLRGSEDLGGGLKAVFEYELGFNLDNTAKDATQAINKQDTTNGGNGINGTRQSYVGLGGGFGTVVVGRLQTPGYYIGKFDALASSTISPQSILSGKSGATIAPNNNGRVNNTIAYMSPNFNGFSAVVAFGSGEENTQGAEKESVQGLGLNYANGPLAVGYVFHHVTNVTANNTANVDFPNRSEHMIGASYDFGMVKVLGSYQNQKNSGGGLTDPATKRDNIWQLGVVVPVGAGNVHLAYGKYNLKSTAASDDAKSWTLAYTHGFSKRTTGYAGYNYTSNDGDNLTGGTAGILAPTPGGNSKAFVVGVRHTF
ncbi:porin [Sulfuricystis multivorans]|uniref:porin n=1 Tax=Sulfuricystis multivorans TaxID=2211108 RepID=UPI000F82B720|nr:porin [Sulfuricystis multivorans]